MLPHNRKPFLSRLTTQRVVRLPRDTIPPITGYGRMIAGRTSLVMNEDVSKLQSADATVFENMELEFPLDPISGASSVEEEDNWGVGPKGLDAAAFWKAGATGKHVRLGIADSGVDILHPTFAKLHQGGRLVAFAHFDKQGKKVVQKSADGALVDDRDAAPTFSHWHGTHCAAILVGEPTNGKARGMAPHAELVVTRVLEQSNVGTVAGIAAGLAWLAEQKCDIVSLSLGWPGKHEVWAGAILEMIKNGTVVVAAVGNEFTVPGVPPSRSPANYAITPRDDKQGLLIAVGAHDQEKNLWDDSGGEVADWAKVTVSGTDGVPKASRFATTPPFHTPTLLAPGVDIISASPNNQYRSSDGTSMATPHVAGLLALILSMMRSRNPEATARQAGDRLLAALSEKPLIEGEVRAGRGMIDTRRLVADLSRG